MHPGSRGRNCAKGPATLNQVNDPDRILYPLKRAGKRGEGQWTRVSWEEALDDIGARIRKAIQENRPNDIMYHVGRPGEDGYTERVLAAWGIDGHNKELLRVETEIGYFVIKAWVTEGIRPGVVGCSHHMGRWKLEGAGQRQLMATVSLDRQGNRWSLSRKKGVEAYPSNDADSQRIWWTDAGIHQNLTFPVHPDPISGMHCWHQAVRVTRVRAEDHYGDIVVDTEKSHAVYKQWLHITRSADEISPDGTRRPYWLLRPLKPAREVYRLPPTKHTTT